MRNDVVLLVTVSTKSVGEEGGFLEVSMICAVIAPFHIRLVSGSWRDCVLCFISLLVLLLLYDNKILPNQYCIL